MSVGHMQGVPTLTLTVSDPKQKMKVHREKDQFVTSYQNQILPVLTNVSLSQELIAKRNLRTLNPNNKRKASDFGHCQIHLDILQIGFKCDECW